MTALFVAFLARGEQRLHALPAANGTTKGLQRDPETVTPQAPVPQGTFLMASVSTASSLPGDQRPDPSHGGGLRTPLLPLITIIMPIRNEARYIARALQAMLSQDYPVDKMEILVIDGMSEDGTRALVTAMAVGEPRVQLLDNPERIVPTALNRGVRAAHGEIIIRVDGHAVIAAITSDDVWRPWRSWTRIASAARFIRWVRRPARAALPWPRVPRWGWECGVSVRTHGAL